MKCEVIRDLFPSYIDGLTSEESNELIEEHLEECRECREYLDDMKEDIVQENQPVKNKEAVKPFRKLRQIGIVPEAENQPELVKRFGEGKLVEL